MTLFLPLNTNGNTKSNINMRTVD